MNIVNTPNFNGYPVLSKEGPLIESIMIGIEKVLSQAMKKHNRLTVMRFELKFPTGYSGSVEVISKCFDSLRYRLNNDFIRKTEKRGRTVQSEIGYVWVKELSSKGGWHYHVAIFLNYDVYTGFGELYSGKTNMFERILSSWASAIGIPLSSAAGLVHVPDNAVYWIWKSSPTLMSDIHSLLYRLSYLAKVATKPYGTGLGKRFFGTSQR